MNDINELSEKHESLVKSFENFKSETVHDINYLFDLFNSLQNEVDSIKSKCEECDDDQEKNEKLRASTNDFLDYKDSIGRNNFIGKDTIEVSGAALGWMEQRGELYDGTKGEKKIISMTVCQRYGLVNKNGYFRLPESGDEE